MEQDITKAYYKFIKEKSKFKDVLKVFPDTPQSFYDFPTIVLYEMSNSDNTRLMTTNRIEYGDDVTYKVDIYTKNITLDGKEYVAKEVINELKELTSIFFRNLGFRRNSSTRGEYIDLSIKRHVMIFSAGVQSWNNYIR